MRSQFVSTGKLDGKQDKHFRRINDLTPAFGHALPLAIGDPAAVFVIGHVRDPYVNTITKSGQVDLSGYWLATFPDPVDALHFFYSDYASALADARVLDKKIQDDAVRTANQDHASIVSLSARQAMASFEITMGKDKKGRWDESKVAAYMKEISSNGDMSVRRVATSFPASADLGRADCRCDLPCVAAVKSDDDGRLTRWPPAAFPIFTYLDPLLLKLLLEPLFDYSESGMYPNKWCADNPAS